MNYEAEYLFLESIILLSIALSHCSLLEGRNSLVTHSSSTLKNGLINIFKLSSV